ncbi:MAG: hypothetical protein ACXU8N_05565 [Telluria sp.]
MQSNQQQNLSLQIALGWVMLLLILSISLLIMVTQGIVTNDEFKVLRADPGPLGLRMIIYLFGIYAVMPVAVSLTQASGIKGLRWTVFVLTVLLFAFFVLHHLSHWQNGDRPDFNSHVLEIAHHTIAVWLAWNTFRWARSGAPAPVAHGVAQAAA